MAKRKPINEYKIYGNITVLFIKNKKNEIFETIINTCDLQKLLNFGHCWHVWKDNSNGIYYIRTTIYNGIINGKPNRTSIYLHKFIYGNTENFIDHINCNSLDNRKENLREITNKNNLTNRKGLNKNNTSGHRNICLINNKWIVQLQINNENKRLKSFEYDELDKAIIFTDEARKKYYGEFSGV
jgi:hypothetical protein